MRKQLGLFLLLVAVMFLTIGVVSIEPAAAIYESDTEVTYKEYWSPHKPYFKGACNDDGSPEYPQGTFYAEPEVGCPQVLPVFIPDDISSALKAEVYVDLWRAYDTSPGSLQINGRPTVYNMPGLDWSRKPFITEVPLSDLRTGENQLTFTTLNRPYHIHDVAIRIYYNDANPLISVNGSDVTPPDADFLSVKDDLDNKPISNGGVLRVNNNQLTFTAWVTDTKFVEFHAYYDGYDVDNDGKFIDWHNTGRNNWHPGGLTPQNLGGTINHVGSKAAPTGGTGQVTQIWNLGHVINQNGVKFKLRVVDAAGNVREAAGGISPAFKLIRDYPVVYYTMPNFDDFGLHMSGQRPDSVSYTFPLPSTFDPAQISKSVLVGMYWKKPNVQINDLRAINVFPAGTDEWALAIRDFNKNALRPGNNILKYTYTAGVGHFIEHPGPMLVLTGVTPTTPDAASPSVISRSPLPGSSNVNRFTSISVRLQDFIGIDKNSVIMTVDGARVNPTYTGSVTDMTATFTPSTPFQPGAEILTTFYACDLLGNCMISAEAFSFTVAPPDVTPPAISDIGLAVLDTKATISWKTDEPATSSIAYGLTDQYEFGTIGSSQLVTNRSLELTGLTPGTTYYYQISSADFDGNQQQSEGSTFTTKQPAGDVVSDDFSSCQLDTDKWTYVNPLNDSVLTFTGEAAQIAVPAGVSHNIWTSGIQAPRLMQLVSNSDMQLETKFDSILTKRTQFEGILVQQDEGNYLRFSFEYNGTASLINVVAATNGTPRVTFSTPITASVPSYMRVDRLGDTWTLSHSNNGQDWIQDTTFARQLLVTQVGVFAGNAGSNPEFTSKIDYFFNRAAPIVPEDGGQRTLDVTVNGGGSVTKNPDKASYNCNEPVILSAAAAENWVFSNWSGALSSTSPIATIVITGSQAVTANFSRTAFNVSALPVFEGVGTGGTITIDPVKEFYQPNDIVTLTADPAEGWDFVGWQGDASGTDLTITVVVTDDIVIEGRFAQWQYDFDVDIVSNAVSGGTGPGGQVLRTPDRETYGYGETVQLVAEPFGGWVFGGWEGDLTGTNPTQEMTIFEDTAITAIFNQETYSLTVQTIGPGTINVFPIKDSYFYGDQVTLTAVPDQGYELAGWSGGLTGSGNPAVITINGDTTIAGTFVIDLTPIEITGYNVEVLPGSASARITWTTDVPGSSRVDYGKSTFYEVGTVSDPALVTNHSLILAGLDQDTEYHFRITSEDQFGNSISSEDDVFTTRQIEGVVSDDFSSCIDIESSFWQFINPNGTATVQKVNGQQVSITVPAGVSHNAFGGQAPPRLMQPVLDEDFVVQAKFDSNMEGLITMQGIIIEEDALNYIAFGFYSRNAGEITVYAAGVDNGTPTTVLRNPPVISGVSAPMYVRVARGGDKWAFEYSFDGSEWISTGRALDHVLTVKKAGFFGGNSILKGVIPGHTATVDYFFNDEQPISPEDSPYPISIQPVGQGTVQRSPNRTGYYCGQVVELTARPANGWSFGSWSGDITGTSPTRTVIVDGAMSVTAMFLEGGNSNTYQLFMPFSNRP